MDTTVQQSAFYVRLLSEKSSIVLFLKKTVETEIRIQFTRGLNKSSVENTKCKTQAQAFSEILLNRKISRSDVKWNT